MHEKRLSSILNAVGSLLNGAKLSLTSIGRHMSGEAKVKHKIKSSYSFPQENILEKLPYHKANKKLYDHIRSKKGHTSIKKKTSSSMDKEYRKSADDPWLIVSSHGPEKEYRVYDYNGNNPEQKSYALKVIKNYSKRMKIEHEFRSTKNPQYGIGLSYSKYGSINFANIAVNRTITSFFIMVDRISN